MYLNLNKYRKQRGVSLIEVLIALVVVAVGVLGLAKMQALAVSNTQASGSRGLIALQAASLAATMHSNKGYWQVTSSNPPCQASSCTWSGSSASSSNIGTVTAASSCQAVASNCSSSQMAYIDVNAWSAQMNQNVPTYSATVNCDAATSTLPTQCSIELTWLEKQNIGSDQALNSQSTATTAVQQSYWLYVQP
jgi:type IV pilus assembly protein PilV